MVELIRLLHLVVCVSDLSFNNIEVIEGLTKLTKLKDLTLYNNRISQLENMDMLTELHVLSIGNNKLHQLDNVGFMQKSLSVFFSIHSFIILLFTTLRNYF